MEELNPYAAPQAQVLQDNAEAVRVRHEFLRAEGHLKAVGLLAMALSLMLIAAKVMMWRILSMEFGMSVIPWPSIVFASLPLVAGLGLYFLKRWSAIMVGVCSAVQIAVNLLQLPGGLLGVIIGVIMLRFLLNAGARRVLSLEYQVMIRQTPGIKSRASTWIFPLIALLLLWFATALMP